MRSFIFFICLVLVFCSFGIQTKTIQAQPYPNRPIQLIIPMAAGGLGDIAGRLLAEDLEKFLGVKVIVMNKPGASMTLGTDLVVRSKKDGYTIAYTGTSALIYTRILNPETVPYEPTKDLEPLGLTAFIPLAVAVQESSPWKTFAELIDYAKKNPGKLRVSTLGLGSMDNFNLEITQSLTGAQFTHIPFKGGESVITALLGGHVEVTYDALSKFIPHVNAGKLRILLVSKKRPEFSNVPTLIELGYKQDLLSGWFALYAPAEVPEEVKKVLVPAIEKSAKNAEIKAKIEKIGLMADYKSPAELKKLLIEDYETAYAIAVKLGLRK